MPIIFCSVALFSAAHPCNAGEWPAGVVGGLQHAGAVHFHMQPGTLDVTLYKRDPAGSRVADRSMKALLCGPEGTVYDQLDLPSNNEPADQPAALQEGKLQAKIDRAGVYTLLVTMNRDQYVRQVSWGFSSNADQFVINAGVGHTDVQRQEAIMLNGEMKPFSIFFQAPKRGFNMDISRLPEIAKTVEIFDASGQLVQSLAVEKGGAKSAVAVDAGNRGGVWELRLPVQRGTILIDGLNQNWAPKETVLPVWSTSREHYFDLADYHWLLQPRRFARQVPPGAQGVVEMSVYNHSQMPMPLKLSVHGAPGESTIEVRPAEIVLAAGAEETVRVRYELPPTLPEANYGFYLTAHDSKANKQAFSLIELRVGQQCSVHADVQLPIELQLYGHDQFQFGM